MVVRKDDMKFKLLMLITISLTLLLSIDVNALEYTGKIYESEPIPDMYFLKHREDTEEEKYDSHNIHRQAYIHRRSTDGAPVYSIESWSFVYGAKDGDWEETTDESFVSLTEEQINMIKKIVYFGYGYKDEVYDHTDKKWYGIAQYLIWKVGYPNIEHYFIEKVSTRKPINKYDKEINELLYMVNNGTNIINKDIKDMFVGDTSVINSANSSQEFTIKNTNNIDVENNFNTSFTIKANKEGPASLNLIEFHEIGESFTYYVSDKYQDSISFGDISMVNYAYNFNVLSGCINVNVYETDNDNKNNKLNNIEYGIYAKDDIYFDGELKYHKDSLVSKSKSQDGKVKFTGILKGKYYIKELSDMSKYYDDGKVIDIEINDYLCQDYNLYYHQQKLKINIKSLVSIPIIQNKEIYYSLVTKKNIKFGIYNESDELISIEKTNEKGQVEFDLLIPYGRYYIKEIEVDKYYIDDFIYEFDFMRVGNTEYQVIEDLEVLNYMKEGNVVININNEDLVSCPKITIVDESKKIIGEYPIDKDGKITISLPYGKYYIKELDDYELIVDKEDSFITGKLKEEITNHLPNVETISGEVIREPNYNYEPLEVKVGKTGEYSYIHLIFISSIVLFILFIAYDKKSYI